MCVLRRVASRRKGWSIAAMICARALIAALLVVLMPFSHGGKAAAKRDRCQPRRLRGVVVADASLVTTSVADAVVIAAGSRRPHHNRKYKSRRSWFRHQARSQTCRRHLPRLRRTTHQRKHAQPVRRIDIRGISPARGCKCRTPIDDNILYRRCLVPFAISGYPEGSVYDRDRRLAKQGRQVRRHHR